MRPAQRIALQNLAHKGALRLKTEHGDVNMASTATIWGEGPNVTGFAWTTRGRPDEDVVDDLRRAGMHATEAQGFVDAARHWAAGKAEGR